MANQRKWRTRTLPFLARKQISVCALAAAVCVLGRADLLANAQDAATSPAVTVEDTEQRAGPFAIEGQNYTVIMQEKRLAGASDTPVARTLAALEIRDTDGAVSYQHGFPVAIERGRFQAYLSANPQLVSGNTGSGLVIKYSDRSASPQTAAAQTNEFWQFFALVNGRLALLGRPTPIGAAGGPVMGVMMRAANGTVSVINLPDTIEVRAWTGFFYVFVPLRVDWAHGGLAQGQRCVERLAGPLQDVGCPMRVEADRKPPAEEYGFVRLFVEARENPDNAEHVVVQQDSRVEILGSSAITTWNEAGELMRPIFSDLWLHVRIADRTGWVHGEEDFAALGLSAGSPAQ